MADKTSLSRWTIQDSRELYGIENWGGPYFNISDAGEVQVQLGSNGSSRAVSLLEILRGVEDRGMTMPVMLRFSNILDSQISLINETFQRVIAATGYQGCYRGVFPIKVNQQHQVVEEVARFGRRYNHGFEAGSKAELIAALAFMQDPEALIICNGYKDAEFIDLALNARRMGLQTVLVVEMPSEVALIHRRAQELGVKPVLGVRVKLSAKGSGQWVDSGGDQSVFGLNVPQIMTMLDELKALGMLDCLQMLHYHLGSQIPNIQTVRIGATEAARVYVDLVREGAAMGYFNMGGGMAVDYDGTHTNFPSSRNYTTEEYCTDVVEAIMKECVQAAVRQPVLVSESGRATVAQYGVLLFNVLEVASFAPPELPAEIPANSHEYTRNLLEIDRILSPKNLQECLNDALYYRDEIRSLFSHGVVSLRERGLAETIFNYIVRKISAKLGGLKKIPEALEDLSSSIGDIYYSNFSLFQSLPDSWAIDQLFPVMPVHRLQEQPDRTGYFSDLTCDCDGKIDKFIDVRGVRRVLPLHGPKPNEDYVIGVFLVGAYQETLGDLHNLFGDTNVVGVRVDESGVLEFSHEVEGDTVADVLSYVEFEPKDMIERFRQLVERSVRAGTITVAERRQIMDGYENGMRGYTYFES